MSHFFQDIGDVISLPVKTAFNFVTDNPKGNSIGDIWDNTVGPGNPLEQLAYDLPGQSLERKLLGNDASKSFELPNWNTLGRPGEAFAERTDNINQALPGFIQPYAQPLEAAALSAFNPYAGAAFETAYQGGKQQQQNKGFDWGELGKNAAINFGTAGVADLANKGIAAANAANASKNTFGATNAVTAAGNAQIAGNTANALNQFGQAGTSAATPGFAATTGANLASNSANALNAVGAIPAATSAGTSALSGFYQPLDSSRSLIPQANALQSSGIGDAAYKVGLRQAPGLARNALTETLAPEGTQPIAGTALDSFSSLNTGDVGTGGSQWGDLLNAFGGSEINTANPNGPRIDSNAFNDAANRLSANAYLQQGQARDQALPAGQYSASQNTPYANRLNEINKGTGQAYNDLRDQVMNANSYYGVIDTNPGLTSDQLDTYLNDPNSIGAVQNSNKYNSIISQNPGLTSDQLDAYLQDPSSGVLGNFRVAPEQQDIFSGLQHPTLPNDFFQPGQQFIVPNDSNVLQGIRSLGPRNTSLLH